MTRCDGALGGDGLGWVGVGVGVGDGMGWDGLGWVLSLPRVCRCFHVASVPLYHVAAIVVGGDGVSGVADL